MNKIKRNSISGAFANLGMTEKDIKVVMPTPSAMAIQHAFNGRVISMPVANDHRNEQMNWVQVHDFVEVLSNFVYNTAKDFNGVTQMIQQLGGVKRVADYVRVTTTAKADIERFTDELCQLKAALGNNYGFITTPEDNAEYIRFFEKLEGFNAYFQGVTHHLMIEMTEFSLEAKDLYHEQQAAMAATQGVTHA